MKGSNTTSLPVSKPKRDDMATANYEIVETDDAGNTTATYVESTSTQDGSSRVDLILPKESRSPWRKVLDVFLPAGYPQSVTNDYLE